MANTSTPTSTNRHSCGDMTLYIIGFDNMVTASTYASGIPGVLGCWLTTYAGATTGEAGLLATANYTNSDTGATFTLLPVTNATTGTLFALSVG
jgi:hypothetical protein